MARNALVSVVAVALMACGAGTTPPIDAGAGGGPGIDARSQDDASVDAPDVSVDASTDGAVDTSANGPPDGASDAAAPTPSAAFRLIYDTILMPKCGGTGGCHVGTAPGGLLTMPDPVTAFANLIDQPTFCIAYPERTGKQTRVVPFDVAKSAITLVNTDGLCGVRHHRYLEGRGFTAADLAALEDWIRQGAR